MITQQKRPVSIDDYANSNETNIMVNYSEFDCIYKVNIVSIANKIETLLRVRP